MNIPDLVIWIQEKHPELVEAMHQSNHHISPTKPNFFHLEGNVWTHLCQVLLVNEKINAGQNARLAALFHDIGKPACRTVDEESQKVFFKKHEPVSAYMCLDLLEELTVSCNLTPEDKVKIFYAICNHIEFHKLMDKCDTEGHLYPFVERYRGMPEMAKVLLELGISDSMGRFAANSKPKNMNHWNLQKQAEDEMIFDNMTRFQEKESSPSIEFLIGLPCSGKSTYRNTLTNKHIICRDDILMSMAKKGSDYKDAYASIDGTAVNTELMNNLKESIRRQDNILIDMTSLARSRRDNMTSHCPHYYKKATLFLDPLSVIYERNEARGKKENKYISKNVYFDMMKSFDAPDFREFDEVVIFYKGQKIDMSKM